MHFLIVLCYEMCLTLLKSIQIILGLSTLNTINSRLKIARTCLKLTQKNFDKPLALSQANIRDLESGRVKMSKLHLIAFDRVYKINPDWLLGNSNNIFLDSDLPEKPCAFSDTVDVQIIKIILEAFEDFLQQKNLHLKPKDKSNIIVAIYEKMQKEGKICKAEVLKYLRVAVKIDKIFADQPFDN